MDDPAGRRVATYRYLLRRIHDLEARKCGSTDEAADLRARLALLTDAMSESEIEAATKRNGR